MAHKTENEQLLFTVSNTIEKNIFLKCYKDTSLLAMLLIAPFGLPGGEALRALNAFRAEEDLSRMFQTWEEVLSRKLFAHASISDDRIASR